MRGSIVFVMSVCALLPPESVAAAMPAAMGRVVLARSFKSDIVMPAAAPIGKSYPLVHPGAAAPAAAPANPPAPAAAAASSSDAVGAIAIMSAIVTGAKLDSSGAAIDGAAPLA